MDFFDCNSCFLLDCCSFLFKAEVWEVLLQLDTMFLREIFHSHSIIINNLSLGMSSIFGLLAKQVRKIPGFFLCMKLTLSSGEETPITSIKSDAHLQWGQIISALQICYTVKNTTFWGVMFLIQIFLS